MLYEDFGGFDGLYMKMLASGIPTAVHLMWIPFSELDLRQQLLLTLRLSCQSWNAFWNAKFVSYGRNWVYEKFKNINDDIAMTFIFPVLELLISYPVLILELMTYTEIKFSVVLMMSF